MDKAPTGCTWQLYNSILQRSNNFEGIPDCISVENDILSIVTSWANDKAEKIFYCIFKETVY